MEAGRRVVSDQLWLVDEVIERVYASMPVEKARLQRIIA